MTVSTVGLCRGRFAPTPSGALHVGSARTALASALSVWSQGGRWLVRVEDLDAARTPLGATEAALADLAWLGLDWDEGPERAPVHAPYLQSLRTALYRGALQELQAVGRVYPCACSRRDVALAAQAPHGAEPVYPGTCRALDPEAVLARARALGRGVSWRFATPPGVWAFNDRVAGLVQEDVAAAVGDFVVWRADDVPAYQLAVVVDDLAMEVTEVVRGDDLLGSTARQLCLYAALGATPPRFAHVGLVLGDDGGRMAKRLGSLSIAGLRAQGVSARALAARLAESLGVAPACIAAGDGPRQWARGFDWSRAPKGPWVWPGL